MKLGLCLLPPLFIPLLSLCYIDIDGTGEYEYVPVEVPKGFSLEAVEVSDVQTNLAAMSLTDANVMEKIAPPVAIREVQIPKDNVLKKDVKSVDIGTSSNEVEDLNRVLPTADDLTFDYNSLYNAQEAKEEEPQEDPLAPVSTVETTTVDYASLYKDTPIVNEEKNIEEIEELAKIEEEAKEDVIEEPVEEEPKIVIHDVVLEAAEPITDPLGPVPINRRYDYQNKKVETPKEEAIEELVPASVEEKTVEENTEIAEINPLVPPVLAPIEKVEEVPVPPVSSVSPISTPTVEEELGELPMQAANPFGDGLMPGLADIPEITLPTSETEEVAGVPEVNISAFAMQGLRENNVVETGTRVDQIVSMNIAEPSQLPVGVLTRPPGKEEVPQPPAPEPVSVPVAPVMPQQLPVNPNMTRAEAMGIRQTFFNDVVPQMPNPNMPNSMAQMPPQTNIFNSPLVPPQVNVGVPGMNYGQPMPQMNYPQPMNNVAPQQPVNAASIFQVNTPNGGSLLRPVENVSTEKNCPVCGVKLKQECPICIMCGFKF